VVVGESSSPNACSDAINHLQEQFELNSWLPDPDRQGGEREAPDCAPLISCSGWVIGLVVLDNDLRHDEAGAV